MLKFSTLTAPQKAKYLVLATLNAWRKTEIPALESGEQLDALYATEEANDDGRFQDARNESRYGTEAPEIKDTPSSRHYEVDAHVAALPDGSWVGWWHYHSGGKHSEPEYAIDWVAHAFDIDHTSEVVTVTKHTFAKREPAQDA